MYLDCNATIKNSKTGNANAIGSDETSAMPPIKVGPAK
jgi:hypothetical protein